MRPLLRDTGKTSSPFSVKVPLCSLVVDPYVLTAVVLAVGVALE